MTQQGKGKTDIFTPAWVDIDFPIIIRTTGTAIPSLTTIQDNITAPQWAVNDFNVCEGQELIHQWIEGTAIYFHIHLLTNGLEAVDKYVRFEVEYFWANLGSAISATATLNSGDLLIPANTADKTMKIFQIGNFIPSGGKIGAHVWARLKRVASSGTAPLANPWVSMLQIHVLCNTIGSSNIGTK